MSSHRHSVSISGKSAYTSTVTNPDLSPYLQTANLEAALKVSPTIASLLLRVAALEGGTVTPPPPPPPPPPPSGTTFLSSPAHAPISLSGQTGGTVGPYSIAGYTGQSAVTLSNCHGVTVQIDVDNCLGGVYAVDCTDIIVIGSRFRNIGDNTIGSGHSNAVQFNRVHGTLSAIRNCKVLGGHTEDMFSIFDSGGDDAAHPIYVEDNQLESPLTDQPLYRAWSSGSGSGTMVESGTHVVIQRNTYLNVGQGGLGFNGGDDVHYLNNVLYGAQRPQNNVGLYGLPATSGLWEVRGNRVWWKNAAGTPNPAWKPGTLVTTPAWDPVNTWQDTTINPADLAVVL